MLRGMGGSPNPVRNNPSHKTIGNQGLTPTEKEGKERWYNFSSTIVTFLQQIGLKVSLRRLVLTRLDAGETLILGVGFGPSCFTWGFIAL